MPKDIADTSRPQSADPIVREARENECLLLQDIELDAARSYALHPGTEFCIGLPPRSADEHRRARDNGRAFVGELDGGPVAFLLAIPLDHDAHIMELAVLRRVQGRGIGRRLIACAEAWAIQSGFAHITLTTFRDVAWNAPFYARIGYRIAEAGHDRPELSALVEEERDAGFHQAPRVVMSKQLIERSAP